MKDIFVAKKMVNLQRSARDRGIEFDLSFATVKRLLSRKTCYYTREELTRHNRSIDRVDNTKGYVDDNVVACTIEINGFKANLSHTQIKRLAKAMDNFLNKDKA